MRQKGRFLHIHAVYSMGMDVASGALSRVNTAFNEHFLNYFKNDLNPERNLPKYGNRGANMKFRHSVSIFLCLALAGTGVLAAEPYSNQPSYNPVPGEFGSGSSRALVPLPPQLPEYLPNGAINLDEVWIQDGGARPYWNIVLIPQQLKMGGATWIDPALVPQLIGPQPKQRRRYRTYRRRPAKVVHARPPANVGSTALKSPTIPLPVTPVEEKKQEKPIPPLTASRAKKEEVPVPTGNATIPEEPDNAPILPPRLQ